MVTVAVQFKAVLTGVALMVNVPLPEAVQLWLVILPQFVVAVSVGSVMLAVSHWSKSPPTAPAVSDLNAATCPFVRALLKLTNTIEARIPMIAMTIKSSMSVKPFF